MTHDFSTRSILAFTGQWGGRTTAVLLFLFWGSFFANHLSEWFLRTGGTYPPAWVWGQMFAHFAMIAGLALMLRWDRLGSLVVVVATAILFGGIGFHSFPYIALVNLIPVVLFSLRWMAGAPQSAPGH
jgi:hypothetical protein